MCTLVVQGEQDGEKQQMWNKKCNDRNTLATSPSEKVRTNIWYISLKKVSLDIFFFLNMMLQLGCQLIIGL